MTASDISTSFCQCNGSSFTERNVHDTSIIYWVYFKALCKTRPVTLPESGDVYICWFCCWHYVAMCHIVLPPLSPTAFVNGNYWQQDCSSERRCISENIYWPLLTCQTAFPGSLKDWSLRQLKNAAMWMRRVYYICVISILSKRNRDASYHTTALNLGIFY